MTETPQTPAGGAPDPSALPAGSSGEEFRKRWKAARSAQAKSARKRGMSYTRLADRSPAQRLKPGMGRVGPPQAPDGDAA